MLELASVVAAPGGFRQVDEGALETPDSRDEVELSCAADRSRRRRLVDAVGESLEARKRLGDRARDVDRLGLFESRQQLGSLYPDGWGGARFDSPAASCGASSSGSSQACARPLGMILRTGCARCFRSW